MPSHIVSVQTALPPHRYAQGDLSEALQHFWSRKHFNPDRMAHFHRHVAVEERYLALSKEDYQKDLDFTARNQAYCRVATELGEQVIRKALEDTQLNPEDIDAIFFTTVTGLSVPTIDAQLINRLQMRRDIKRTPLFGLGCVAGAAGIARVHDYLRAWPEHTALLLSVELCSLTLQTDDLSIPNLISTGLFGDGAAAVIMLGERARDKKGIKSLAQVKETQSAFYYNSERVMGWDIGTHGFKIVLSAEVPAMIQRYLREDVDAFLKKSSLSRSDIEVWVSHPGGPKVIDAIEEVLDLDPRALALTRDSLSRYGNLSSASVLFVLQETLARVRFKPRGTYGLLLALGPGFCSELVLLQGIDS